MRWRVGLLVAAGLLGFGILFGRLVSAKQLRQIPVAIAAEGATLNGSLHVPHGKTSALPVVVLLHGSGPDGRSNPYYRRLAEQFGQVGFATFIYDKRGTGESGGHLMSVPFQTIIDDAVKVVTALRQRPEVMGEFIVVWGGAAKAVQLLRK